MSTSNTRAFVVSGLLLVAGVVVPTRVAVLAQAERYEEFVANDPGGNDPPGFAWENWQLACVFGAILQFLLVGFACMWRALPESFGVLGLGLLGTLPACAFMWFVGFLSGPMLPRMRGRTSDWVSQFVMICALDFALSAMVALVVWVVGVAAGASRGRTS